MKNDLIKPKKIGKTAMAREEEKGDGLIVYIGHLKRPPIYHHPSPKIQQTNYLELIFSASAGAN